MSPARLVSVSLALAVMAAAPTRTAIAEPERRAAAEVDREVGPAHPPDPAEAADFTCGKPRARFTVTFKDEVALPDLVTWAMGISCKRFLYGKALAGRTAKVVLVTPGALSAREAWAVFEVALAAMGVTAVDRGQVYEIVETATAREAALTIRRKFPAGGGGPVRLLLRPEHVAVTALVAALDLVKSRHGTVAALPDLRAVLVTDDGEHVARMKTLVAELDQPGDGAGVHAVPVAHRDAAELAALIEPLVAGEGGPAAPGPGTSAASRGAGATRLAVDTRLNVILVVGSDSLATRVEALVAALDLDDGDSARAHAVRLRHATAEDVAAALAPLVGGATTTKNGGASDPGAAPTGPVRISADQGTNSILFLASARDAVAVEAMIAELDAPRRLVYLEATIVEAETNFARDLGVAWHSGTEIDGNTVVVGRQGDGLSSIRPKSSLGTSGVVGALLGSSIDVLGMTVPSLGALLEASAHTGQLEVLAAPHVMAVDNRPAKISVGSNIPYKSTVATTNTQYPTAPSIERQKVALSLVITPHVAPAGDGSGDDRVRLDVKLESRQLGTEDFGDGLGPTWKERELETTVVLRDQDSMVLGGLIDERIEHTVDGIPVLSDLPLLGALFRSTRTVRQRANILIVITPHLIDDSSQGWAVFERRMREQREFLRARTDLAERATRPRVDYARKRGLIAEIDAAVRAVERQRIALETIRKPARPRGRIDRPAPAGTVPAGAEAAVIGP